MVNTRTTEMVLSGHVAGFDIDETHFRERLQTLVDRVSGGNVAAFARLSGVPHTTLRKHLSGETEAGRVNLLRYAAAAAVSIGWLLSGTEDGTGSPLLAAPKAPIPTGLEIPLYDGELSAIPGKLVSASKPADRLILPRSVVSNVFRSHGDLLALRVTGDMMAPTIRDGAIVVIERTAARINSDGQVYAMRRDDILMIKRAHMLPGLGVCLRGDNPGAPEVTLSHEEAERLHVIGRVCGVLYRP